MSNLLAAYALRFHVSPLELALLIPLCLFFVFRWARGLWGIGCAAVLFVEDMRMARNAELAAKARVLAEDAYVDRHFSVFGFDGKELRCDWCGAVMVDRRAALNHICPERI